MEEHTYKIFLCKVNIWETFPIYTKAEAKFTLRTYVKGFPGCGHFPSLLEKVLSRVFHDCIFQYVTMCTNNTRLLRLGHSPSKRERIYKFRTYDTVLIVLFECILTLVDLKECVPIELTYHHFGPFVSISSVHWFWKKGKRTANQR